MQVRICSGKPTTIVASKQGFYPAGKRVLLSHSLAGLLQQINRIFDSVSEARFYYVAHCNLLRYYFLLVCSNPAIKYVILYLFI